LAPPLAEFGFAFLDFFSLMGWDPALCRKSVLVGMLFSRQLEQSWPASPALNRCIGLVGGLVGFTLVTSIPEIRLLRELQMARIQWMNCTKSRSGREYSMILDLRSHVALEEGPLLIAAPFT